jgi:hypothetical protein
MGTWTRRKTVVEMILGKEQFIERLLSEAEGKERETLRLSRKVPDLATLAKRVVKGKGMEEGDLCSSMRRRRVVKGNKMFRRLAAGRRVGIA